jgi:hypothetical protein
MHISCVRLCLQVVVCADVAVSIFGAHDEVSIVRVCSVLVLVPQEAIVILP